MGQFEHGENYDRNIADQEDWLPQEGGNEKGVKILFK